MYGINNRISERSNGRLFQKIIATTALELGIDIGALDAVILLGFPKGDIASFVSTSSVTIEFIGIHV
jgi:ATP-dependent helicase YprA (DUF1998 family)